jgi:hypothetical protein
MRTLAIVIAICVSAKAAELYIFSRDGISAASTPRELPSVGQPLDAPNTVVVLHAATPSARAACGWYLYAPDTNPAPAGMTLSNRWIEINGTTAIERKTWKPRPPANFEISKYQLLIHLAETNALAPFVSYLDSDPVRRLLWDAAVTLDATNAMVQAAAAEMAQSLGHDTVTNILWRSRAR